MKTAEFDYTLPSELIAQQPAAERDHSRLLVLDRPARTLRHRHFFDLPGLLQPGDLLVLNDSKVIPARLRGIRAEGGGHFEILLLRECGPSQWWAMIRPARRMRPGTRLLFLDRRAQPASLQATVLEKNHEGHCRLEFTGVADLRAALNELGEIPLPPYIPRPPHAGQEEDRQRYQTVYAATEGSVAAPTAGLHFTTTLLELLRAKGIQLATVTLHVGLGTFAPIKTEEVEQHPMHEEVFEVPPQTARRVNQARAEGRRVVAVGTTSLRVLESVARLNGGEIVAGSNATRLFIYPPSQFLAADALITNFHLPQTTLLMLVCAFAAPGSMAGRDWILSAYQYAIQERYRFFSYGDAMFVC